MLLPHSTLKQIECYEVSQCHVIGCQYTMDDVIVLHFKQWWKFNKTLKIRRITSDIDYLRDTFFHVHSEYALEILTQLREHMESTFYDSPEKRQKAKILSIVPSKKDDT